MREHYEAQLTTLNTEMIQMGALCEDAISGAIQALLEDDKHLAEKVGQALKWRSNQHERDIERALYAAFADAAAGGDRPACGFFCPENDF